MVVDFNGIFYSTFIAYSFGFGVFLNESERIGRILLLNDLHMLSIVDL